MNDLVKHIAFHVPRIAKASGGTLTEAWIDFTDIISFIWSFIKHLGFGIVSLISIPFLVLCAIGLYIFFPTWRKGVKERNAVREARKND